MPVEPHEAETTVDTHDDRPAVSDAPGERDLTGERDLMFGMTVGAVMAFGAIALAIIFSL